MPPLWRVLNTFTSVYGWKYIIGRKRRRKRKLSLGVDSAVKRIYVMGKKHLCCVG